MQTFLNWFNQHRKTIGYIVGGLNLGSGLAYIMADELMTGLLWVIVGAVIIIDTREFK
jgi:hypothetical protein